jgi:hypothetical protein
LSIKAESLAAGHLGGAEARQVGRDDPVRRGQTLEQRQQRGGEVALAVKQDDRWTAPRFENCGRNAGEVDPSFGDGRTVEERAPRVWARGFHTAIVRRRETGLKDSF